MRYELVIFDLDGTLVDTIEDLGTAVNHALAQKNLPLHEISEYRLMVGNGIGKLVKRAMPGPLQEDAGLFGELLDSFVKYYSSHLDVHSRPYPGMTGLLARLSAAGMKLAVASNKFQAGAETIVGRFFPGVDFCAVLGGRDGAPLKPDPEVVREILDKAGVLREKAVMVGDSATDMLTAKAADICGIAVSWGFRPQEAAAECSFRADTAEELEKLLLG